jgi:L,D-transpeptidase catalytic domain
LKPRIAGLSVDLGANLGTVIAQRDKASSHRHRCFASRRGVVCALGVAAALALTSVASPAAASYRTYQTRHKIAHKGRGAGEADKQPFGDVQKGPLQIFISINQQKLRLYSDGVHVADSSVATGVPKLPTPLGVFSVIQKQVFHRSNIYSNAPMPYMQRITWSGVAMHEGENIGHPASHGCIRMPHDFAARLYRLTKLGARVIISRSELKPAEFADAHLFVHKEQPPETAAAPASPNAVETAADKSVGSDAPAPGAAVQLVSPPADPKVETPAASSNLTVNSDGDVPTPPAKTADYVKAAAAKATPITIFISRKRGRLYVRQDFAPLFDIPITIAQPDELFGTHVFTALEFTGADHTTLRWNVVSLPGEPQKRTRTVENRSRHGTHARGRRLDEDNENEIASPPPQTPAEILARIDIPPDVIETISELIVPGSSLVVSDQGLGDETGEGTDFIVVTR